MTPAPLAYSNASHSLVVQALCRDLLNRGVDLDISAADEMLLFFLYSQGQDLEQAVAMYLESGRRIWEAQRQVLAWRFGSMDWGGRVLDFASGYGRVVRHITAEIPRERVWVADVYAEGVAFQERVLGVHGIVSSTGPEQFPCDTDFDAVLVSSLFTHLPEPRFLGWLRRLGSLVRPGGLLLFSVHDMSIWTRRTGSSTSAGIVFEELSESGSLSTSEYGSAWVTEEFVRSAVRQAVGPCPVLRIPRGLASFQDLYVVLKEERAEGDAVFSDLRIEREADGFLEHCSWVGARTLQITGWIADRLTGRPPEEVRIWIDGVRVATCRDLQPRPAVESMFTGDSAVQVVGWRVKVDLPATSDPDSALLSVRPVASDGRESSLYSGKVVWACLRTAQLDAVLLQKELSRREAVHADEIARQRDHYENRLRAMEASRFWKARNAWFRFKRAVGWTEEA
ncbi:MAG TPA: class I SAM-dependent methyltransferase [Thermoanaerobaculia bacterium]|nr:class I SAM-dependent methyltransferase [Thermoanaerobaculia bacterium]